MSWLARSIANSLKFDDDDDDDVNGRKAELKQHEGTESPIDNASSLTSPSSRVKEDLSEISRTLTRQFRGFASFLAPPPESEHKSDRDVSGSDERPGFGFRGDFAEIGGRFRSGISKLSRNINVSEITKMASDFLQLESDDENGEEKGKGFKVSEEGAVGVTEEVVAFARDIAIHPETWLDFPLPENPGDEEDFYMSDEQHEHALAVEQLAPRLAALRMELCPRYISDDRFWKIYFVLVHTRLDKHDAVLLSTPQVMEARALLANELKHRNTTKLEESSSIKSLEPEEKPISHHEQPLSVPFPVPGETMYEQASFPVPGETMYEQASERDITMSMAQATSEIPKHSFEKTETPTTTDNSVSEKDVGKAQVRDLKSDSSNLFEEEEDDTDDWLKEDTADIGGIVSKSIPIQHEDDVSFSDLEEDDGDVQTSFRKSNYSSDKDSRDWVQLGKSSPESSNDTTAKLSDREIANDPESKESSDWLDIDDIIVS